MAKRNLWEIWKDGFISAIPWRMMTPLGIMAYKTKRDALAAAALYCKEAKI